MGSPPVIRCALEGWNLNLTGRIGLFGGTFNPLHSAHLLVAEAAYEQFGLSQVIFIPSGIPPHKEILSDVTSEDRYAMVKLAIAEFPHFSVSRIEIDRDGPSYTIDTIRALQGDYPQGLCFIVGADLLLQIETWKEPHELLASVPFIIAPRDGIEMDRFLVPPFDRARISFLEMDEVDLSSTWVREQIMSGGGIPDCVPGSVARYIEEHGLYQYREPVHAN
ncbi:MAG TPA: nicotinate-nucleotide adenylyltransferase [Candidatus Acetothermia bacterium]|nr:nicotinate-nucleotide adenylyltransferase [Candidatus Acetothermia bacterium]HEX32621.1 nicotinate-nucleotide adenylyltransferase [Candidatus Acetothermia bacterium]